MIYLLKQMVRIVLMTEYSMSPFIAQDPPQNTKEPEIRADAN